MEFNKTFTLNPQFEVMDVVDIVLFSLIFKHKSLRFEEIESKIGDSKSGERKLFKFDNDVERREKIKASLKELENKGFIKKKSAVIEDFETYYVTAKGLQESRKMSNYM